MRKLVLLFCWMCLSNIPQVLCQNGTAARVTLELLEQGEKQTDLKNGKDVVLVLGPTGSGKSTFVQWMAGDNTNLISKERFPDSGEYFIEDINDKIGSSTVSKTPFPGLEVDASTGTTFYDFPGFSDKRSSSNDIAASFFKESVVDHIKNVKILFMTSYYTVQEGMDRTGFPGLLKSIDGLIGDVDKFKNSIGLVVSKVDSFFIRQGRTFILKSDSTVITGIVKYLRKFKKVLEGDLTKPNINDKKKKFSTNAIKFINILLTREDGQYTRIKLFRRPDEAGPLSDILLLTEGKLTVQQMISDSLRFTNINNFVTAINDQITNDIVEKVTEINDEVTDTIGGIVTDIQKLMETFVEPVRIKIESNNLDALSLDEALEFSIQIKKGQGVLSDAVDYFTHSNGIGGMGETLATYLSKLGMEVSESMVENMSELSKNFDFLQLFSETPLPVSSLSWVKSFQSPLNYLTETEQFIKDKASSLAEGINSQITFHVDSISGNVKLSFMDQVHRMTETIKSLAIISSTSEVNLLKAKAFHEKLESGEELLTKLTGSVKVLKTPQLLSVEISKTLSSMDFELPTDDLSKISAKSQEIAILQEVSDTNFSFPSAHWSNSFKTVVTYIQSQNLLTLAEHTNEAISSNVDDWLNSLAEKIRSIVDKKSLELEVNEVGDELKRWQLLFASVRDGFQAKTTLEKLLSDVTFILSKLNVKEQPIRANLRFLEGQDKSLEFLNALQRKGIDVIANPAWKAVISDLVEYIGVQFNFNTFVTALYENLSQFNVQSDVTRYDVQDLANWGKPLSPQGIHVDKNNFKLFMNKVKEFKIKAADNISNIVPSESQIAILNNVLKITLKKRVVTQCPNAPNSTLVLTANFIKFSDFLDPDGKFMGCGWKHVSSLEIYALNSLFIDRDLNALGEKLKLSIIAPRWEVIGTRRIRLDGEAGQFIPKAADGPFPGGHGRNGSSGLPGGSAGSFFGVVSAFFGSEKLTISANGGNGGSGQSGGNGGNGEDGETPPVMNELSVGCDTSLYKRNGFVVSVGNSYSCGYRCRNDTVYGLDGAQGGNAGKCGLGGQGGFSGQITFITLTGGSREQKIANDGRNGVNGVLGARGLGGMHGSNRKVSCHKQNIFSSWRLKSLSLESRGTAANGSPSYGCNSNLPENPLRAETIQNSGSSLRTFTSFLIENSNERFVRLSTQQIYEQINNNSKTRSLQDTLGLIEDLKMLESFPRESNLNLLPFYKSHLTDIENYAANPTAAERSDEFKKVLSFLYTASLTQMSNLKKNQDSDLVIDVGGYLDIVSQNVKTLSSLQDESRLVTVVETIKNNFKIELDVKIEEAQNLIKITIIPEMATIGSQFDAKISGLVNETIALQNAAHDEKAALIEKKAELEKAMVLNTIFNVFKVVGQVSSFFGPVGEVVAIGIEVGTSVTGALIQGNSLKLPSSKSKSLEENLQGLGDSALDLAASIKKDQNNIAEVTRGINDLEKTIKELEEFEAKIYKTLVPVIENMGKNLIKTANNLESKSSVFLDVTSWQVQNALEDTSREIQQFTRGFEVHESVVRSVEKLQEVMTVLVKVYDRIQDYQEQQRLAVYMAQLSSASVKQIVVSNPEISNSIRDLKMSIQSNILLNQYNSALNAFKQWIFPFADVFLKDFQLPANLVTSNTDIEVLSSTAASHIEDIRSRIQKYKTTIEDFDKHIHFAQFNGSSAVMKPFYVWKNKENRDMIKSLLAGETVFVKADVAYSTAGQDAIKFDFIEFGLKSDDPMIQAEVDRKLLNYVVSMTHLGTSYYRYNGQYYSIVSPSHTMRYSFEKGTILNNVSNKLKGDLMLSPYAMWELCLEPSKNAKFSSSLDNFWDQVDLVLEGSGSFVTVNPNLDVESYYKVDDSIRLLLN